MSDSLQNLLLDNDQISFWKLWRKKFGSKTKQSNCIDGISDEICIANHFGDTFAKTCKNVIINQKSSHIERKKFINRLSKYKGQQINLDEIVSMERIQAAVNALNDKKAAGYDLLTAEH